MPIIASPASRTPTPTGGSVLLPSVITVPACPIASGRGTDRCALQKAVGKHLDSSPEDRCTFDVHTFFFACTK